MSGAGWVGIACLAVAPFLAAEYQRRVWLREQAMKAMLERLPQVFVQITADLTKFIEGMERAAATITAASRAMMVPADEFAAELLRVVAALPESVGEMEMVRVRLDECWRCSVTIPKEDPLGLCSTCRVQLRNL